MPGQNWRRPTPFKGSASNNRCRGLECGTRTEDYRDGWFADQERALSAPDLRKKPSKRWLGYTVGPPDSRTSSSGREGEGSVNAVCVISKPACNVTRAFPYHK